MRFVPKVQGMTRFRALTTVLAGVLGVLATMAVVARPVSGGRGTVQRRSATGST